MQSTSLLKTKRYGLFWLSSLLSNIGTWMQQVAQPWVMLTISHSSFLVGLDSFAMNAPGWILTLFGGVLADRLDRKRVILFFQGIQFISIAVLVALLAIGVLKAWMLILISLIVGTTDSLSMPSFQTIVPSLVEADEIPRAISLNSIQFNLARTLGPAIAGIVMLHFGAIVCVGANAVSFIPFFLSIFWIYPIHGFKSSVERLPESSHSPLKTLKEIFTRNELQVQLLTIFVTTFFCSPIITFCPVLIKEIFSGHIENFGFASAAFGVGGLVGALFAFLLAMKFKSKTPGALGCLLGVVVFILGLNHSFGFLILLMMLGGALLTMANTSASSNLQMRASNKVRGQYASMYQLAFRGGIALGSLLTGLVTSRYGVSVAFLINGVLAASIHLGLLVRAEWTTRQNLQA